MTSPMGQSGASIPANQAKYFDLLARYYVLKRQHLLAAHVLLRLAERRSTDAGDVPTLEQRLNRSFFTLFSKIFSENKPQVNWNSNHVKVDVMRCLCS